MVLLELSPIGKLAVKRKAKKLMHPNDLVSEETGRRVRRITVEFDYDEETSTAKTPSTN